MFGEDTANVVVGSEAPVSSGSSIWGAITGATANLVSSFPTVAKDVIAAKAAESTAAAQAKLAEAETKKLQAQAKLTPVVQTIKQESKWAIPLLVGGVGLLGVALWMRKRSKRR